MIRNAAFFSFILLTASAALAQAFSSNDVVKKLHDLFNEDWQWTLEQYPESATLLGDNRYNDRLTDYSLEAIERGPAVDDADGQPVGDPDPRVGGERQRLAEASVRTIYLHAHMDEDTFDCSRAMLCPDLVPTGPGRLVPACTYNLFYRMQDERFFIKPTEGGDHE